MAKNFFEIFGPPLKPDPGGLDQVHYIIGKPTSSSRTLIDQIFRMPILPVHNQLPIADRQSINIKNKIIL